MVDKKINGEQIPISMLMDIINYEKMLQNDCERYMTKG